jgi:hypothetical protein
MVRDIQQDHIALEIDLKGRPNCPNRQVVCQKQSKYLY